MPNKTSERKTRIDKGTTRLFYPSGRSSFFRQRKKFKKILADNGMSPWREAFAVTLQGKIKARALSISQLKPKADNSLESETSKLQARRQSAVTYQQSVTECLDEYDSQGGRNLLDRPAAASTPGVNANIIAEWSDWP